MVEAVLLAPLRIVASFVERIENIEVRDVVSLRHGELLHRLSNTLSALAPPAARVDKRILDRQHRGYGKGVLFRKEREHNAGQIRVISLRSSF